MTYLKGLSRKRVITNAVDDWGPVVVCETRDILH